MKEYNWLLLATLMVGVVSAQKLFFKSNKLIQEEIEQHLQKAQPVKGFGFGEPRHYFTSHRKIEDLPLKVSDNVVVCPDKKTACPDGNTCCQTSPLGYGCCPLPMASCCPDKRHCCPTRTRCDQVRQACISGVVAIPWFEKTAGITLEQPEKEGSAKVESVICPDGEYQCADGQTCCRSREGYSCCPIANAVCCSDEVHCCPTNTTCDVAHGRCNKGITGEFVDWVEKVPTQKVKLQSLSKKLEPVNAARLSLIGSVNCDDKHVCPTGNTCCKMANNEWGCCPKPEAECCEDKLHCCPKGSKCEPSSGNCVKGLERVPWLQKQPAIVLEVVKCDERHECPTKNTCCKLSSGQWGCCPLPEAVCCSDGVHCCPSGTTCDVSSGKCNQAGTQIDWFMKQPAKEVGNVQCDSTHECPSENTCCKLASGQWGCCPLPNAVCCSDHEHCCPSGTTCDPSSGKCDRGNIHLDWFVKQPAILVGNVQCDSTHECPSENTCCKLSSGQWGCCPLPNAVCCSDGVHCCPSGTTCDVSSGKCNQAGTQIDWFVKQPAKEVGNVRCDSTHECPPENTCCKLSSGQWGCCPLPNAVCCSDGVHCCPSGTTCDVSSGKCNRGDIQLDWFVKTPAMENIQDVICPDGSECQDGQTCCEMNNGVNSYGCCPLPNAVCCNDGQHCCPHSYRCDIGAGACVKGIIKLPWIRTNRHHDNTQDTKNIEIVKNIENTVLNKETNLGVSGSNIFCTDGTKCPDGYSCCENGKGGYNCCPMPNGVCCDDHQHCCPHGYICDEEPGICRIPETNTASSNFIRKLGSKRGAPLS